MKIKDKVLNMAAVRFKSLLTLAVLTIFILITMATSISDNGSQLTPKSEIGNLNGPSSQNYTVGDVVNGSIMMIVVLGWDYIEGDEALTKGKKYVAVDLVLKSNSPKKEFPEYSINLIDEAGNTYQTDEAKTFKKNPGINFCSGIYPRETQRGKLCFQVLEESNSFLLALNENSYSSSREALIDLGLRSRAIDLPSELTKLEGDYAIGDIIEYQNESLVLSGWRFSQGSEGSRPENGTKLIVIDLLIINNGESNLEF